MDSSFFDNGPGLFSIWFFVILLVISGWAVLDRLLIPSVRWFLRRRLSRVIDEINTRLDIQIRPFQLTKRQVLLIDRLVYDPKVIEAIQSNAQARNAPREMVQAEVLTYAREIVASFWLRLRQFWGSGFCIPVLLPKEIPR